MGAKMRIAVVTSAGAVVVVSGASCGFEPLIADGAFSCSSDGACPNGYVCKTDNRCYRPSAGPGTSDDAGLGADALEDGSQVGATGPFRIGGAVSGLSGKGLVLQDVGTDDLPIAMDGPFFFATLLPTGALYNVTVSSQPSEPTQICSVVGGTGAVTGADVTNIAVACQTEAFTIGGTIVGLGSGSGLVLQNNGAGDLAVQANSTMFTFGAKTPSGSPFNVTIKTQPSGGGPCNVTGGSGTVGVTNVTSVVVNCVPNTYTVGGSVTGLNGTVILRNNGGNDLQLTSNGSYAFSQPIKTSDPYSVTVATQPGYPPQSQTCSVANPTGTMGTSNVTNVNVTCATNKFTIGGSVTGLNGMLILQNNNGDDLTVKASGTFTFNTPVASGSTYSVKVKTQPAGQACTVASSSGTVANANVTNVTVSCSASNPGILCGTLYCNPSTQVCCSKGADGKSPPSCEPKTSTCKDQYVCDDVADCAGATGTICCGELGKGKLKATTCVPAQSCAGEVVCDPNAMFACPVRQEQCKVGGVIDGPDFAKDNYGFCQ